MYIDGRCHKVETGVKAGFTVVRQKGDELEVGKTREVFLPSAQRAELEALWDALCWARRKKM